MDASTPIVLAGAKFKTRDEAELAFKEVWGAHHEGELDHTSIAFLSKDAEGNLQVERHDSTAKHFAWGGALIGAALCVVAPPVGIAMVAGTAGAGAIVGHFWHNVPKEKVQEISELLESGESGLLIVAVNKKGTDIKPLLAGAVKSTIVETKAGDIDAKFEKAVSEAKAAR